MTTESTTTASQAAAPIGTLNTKDMRRILASSFIGSAIEYYDFMLYATAASLVFDKVFFANLGPGFALFASFVTLAVGYVARPLGGLVFGHFGDLVGRKKVLVLSMVIMGAGTVAIGLLPPTAQVGMAAPITLVVLRLIQGVAVGGEWGGAALMAIEHAPKRHRGFAASFANAGGPAGAILGTLGLSLFAALSGSQFLVWGWRVPFLLSAVLIGVGLVIRLKVSETPAFQRLETASEKRRVPIAEVLRHSKRAVLLGLAATTAFYVCQAMTTVWGVSVAVASGADKNGVLNIKAAAAVLTLVVCFISARLSDRLGRRRVLAFGALLGIVAAYPTVLLMTNGTLWGFGLAIVIGNGLVQGVLYGPIAAYVAEQFPTRHRYTGASVAYHTASMLGAGFTPMIITGLILAAGGALWPVAVFWVAVLLVALVAVLSTAEGTRRELD
ncbi:MFS transporter [Sinomonas atrocyanea]|uniref:MFS transporter n=1 Tax=Sinomonas atrocyanea TaxID=37927 RepID=A0A126ZXK3_9MICC|nr:MFS transporter [Sinomonas atrocyanea]AMM31843.1 MFS transporter [Sinomonas atrocyanea]GEB65498.1 MFS transporter [Sinomonas atrocyanea]GGG71632.1 MFS transporter [Sinomonas atrocyanea]